MDNDIGKIKYIFSRFYEPVSLALLILSFSTFFTIINQFIKEGIAFWLRVSFFTIFILLLAVIWLVNKFRLPRFKEKKKIGIILSIFSEDEKDLRQIKDDIISRVKKDMLRENLTDLIGILIVPNHLSKKILTAKDVAEAHAKVGGHLFIQGNIKKRSDEKEKNFVELEGRVIHAPIDLDASKGLSVEFRKALPPEIIDDPNFQIRQIKFTSDTIAESSKYIIGIAALISGDPLTAIKFHETLLNSFDTKVELTENDNYLKQKTINNLAFENMILASHYLLDHNQIQFQRYFDQAKKYNPDDYGVLLVEAIEKFQNGDTNAAKEDICKAKELALGRQDWRYSEAFLHYWTGEFKMAYESSKKIFLHEDINKERIAHQVIGFNLGLVNRHENKPQLKFWIAYLYYKCLGNITMAHKYFSEFVQTTNDRGQQFLRGKAKTFLLEIEKEMSIKYE